MLKAGVIEPSRSPWASRVVIVKKKDGTPRFCVDYRALNLLTVKDSYPLPYQTDLMDNISNAQYFSSLDLASGYWQIKLDDDAKAKSAFTTRYGLFQFNVMPFGLTNAPATFQRLMDLVLAGLTWIECMVYLDDIIIFSPTWKEHLKRLKHVFERLRESKLKAKMSKCQFGREKLKYLGHVISAAGIATDPEKITVIEKLTVPTTVTELRAFLGMVGYYRRFIPHYSDVAAPLHKLLRKHAKFEWNDECTASFNEFKRLLIQSPILQRPDFKRPFQIVCDASNIGIGAVLEQLDDNGIAHTIAYWSKTMNSAQQHYHTSERELLAVVESIKNFRHYVGGSKFKVFTDHNALTHLDGAKELSGRLQRWALFLQEYNIEWQYRKGSLQGSADGLSRLGHDESIGALRLRLEEEKKEVEQETLPPKEPQTLDPRLRDYSLGDQWQVMELRKIDAHNAVVRNYYLKAQKEDPIINLFRQRVLDPELFDRSHPGYILYDRSKELQNFIERYSPKHFKIINDLLYHLDYDTLKEQVLTQLCVPLKFQQEVMSSLHENFYGGGHLGINKCYDKLRNRYWWPKCYNDLEKWIKSCPKCQRLKSRADRAPLQPNLVTTQPWECVGVDILGPLPKTTGHQYEYIIVFIDHFTNWVEAAPLKNIDARSCADAFIRLICTRYGPPRKLLSDRGSQFLSSLAAEVNLIMGVKKLNTTAYHPQTNGKVERFNNTLVKMLAMYVSMKQKDWDQFIPYALFAYNTSRHELNKFSPYYMLFGREPEYMTQAMVRTDSDTFLSVGKWPRKIIRRIRRAHEIAKRNQRVINNRYEIASMAKGPKEFAIGDMVLMKYMIPPQEGSQKFQEQWHGPYEVLEKLAPVTYRIAIPSRDKRRTLSYILHVNRLRKYEQRDMENDNGTVQIEPESVREKILRNIMAQNEYQETQKRVADNYEKMKD